MEAQPDQPTYVASPTILGIEAFTIGGTAPTVHAEVVHHEVARTLRRHPGAEVPAAAPAGGGFGGAGHADGQCGRGPADLDRGAALRRCRAPTDRHFRIDSFAGEVQFGPAVRSFDGGLESYGAIPPAGATLWIDSYRTGGGQAGNVARGQVRVLKTSIPYVSRVENRSPAIGGAEAESLEPTPRRAGRCCCAPEVGR